MTYLQGHCPTVIFSLNYAISFREKKLKSTHCMLVKYYEYNIIL